jgi:aldose 1-epimerase
MRTLKLAVVALIVAAATSGAVTAKTQVTKRSGGKLPDGSAVEIYTLTDEKLELEVMTYGGFMLSLKVPDKNGKMDDVLLGFDNPAGYYENNHSKSASFFCPIVGRYANRIAHAKFTLNGKEYNLTKNNGDNTLHGGPNGFHNHIWNAKIIADGVELKYVSKDGEEGYPGNLTATVRYTVKDEDVKIEYFSATDKPTVVNLTSHGYFNLAGQVSGTILGEQLKLNASKFTPVDSGLIPTGELKPVAGTPFDFLTAHAIGERINANDEQLKLGHDGYDHNFVIDGGGMSLTQAAEVYDPASGRVMQVLTTEPGVQFYTGNFLDGSIEGKKGMAYVRNAALCLETQHFPDSPNHPAFPATTLNPGQKFHSETIYRFSVR